MHSNAVHTRRFSYAAIFGRGGSLARATTKMFMITLMMFGMATQAQAEGNVNLTTEKTGFWAVLFSPFAANSTATSAAEVCEAVGKSAFGVFGISVVFVGTSPNATYFAGYEALNCLFRDSVTGITLIQNAVFPVTRAVCPPNSSPGMPCTCNATYKPDPTITQCIPVVLYTIALHNLNLGGELKISASRAAYAQVMEGAAAKSGIAVTLKTTALPEAGTATLSPTDGKGTTDAEGKFNFTFNAPPVAGTHTVTATCDGGKCSNQATGTIVVTACTVPQFTELSVLSERLDQTQEQKDLTKELERGIDAYSFLTQATKNAEQCFRGKVSALLGSAQGYTLSSTVRTPAYQAHLREIWDKFVDLKKLVAQNPAYQQHCQTLITKVEGKMGFLLTQNPSVYAKPKKIECNKELGGSGEGHRSHCIRARPAIAEPEHVAKKAFDVSSDTAVKLDQILKMQNELLALETPPAGTPITVGDVANSCNLKWAGLGDPVHFSLQ